MFISWFLSALGAIAIVLWFVFRRCVKNYEYVQHPDFIAYKKFKGVRTFCLLRDYLDRDRATRKKGNNLVAVKRSFTFVVSDDPNDPVTNQYWLTAYQQGCFLSDFNGDFYSANDCKVEELLKSDTRFREVALLRVPFTSKTEGMDFTRQQKFYTPSTLDDCRKFFATERKRREDIKKSFYYRLFSKYHKLKTATGWVLAGAAAALMLSAALITAVTLHKPLIKVHQSLLTLTMDTPHGRIAYTKSFPDDRWLKDAVMLDADDLGESGMKIDRCKVNADPVRMGGGLVRVDIDCDHIGRRGAQSAVSENLQKGDEVYVRYARLKQYLYDHDLYIINQEEAEAYVSSGRFSYYSR